MLEEPSGSREMSNALADPLTGGKILAELKPPAETEGDYPRLSEGDDAVDPWLDLDLSDGPVFIYDPDGICRGASGVGERHLGQDANQIVGSSIFELSHGRPSAVPKAWRRLTDSKEPASCISEVTVDGERHRVQTSLFPVMDASGQVRSVVSMERPLVGREALRRENRTQGAELALVRETASIISSSLDMGEVYWRLASELRKLVDFDAMSVTLLDETSTKVIRAYTAGLDPESLHSRPEWPLEDTEDRWVVEDGASVVERDLSRLGALRFAEDETLLRSGFRSGIRVPLVTKSRVIGVLALWSCEPETYGPREQRVLEGVAALMAPAIENARLKEEFQRTLDTLRSTQDQMVRMERLRAMGELASGVAHDFNNSLAAILGRTQLLMSQITSETHLRSLSLIERAARDSAQVVRRILDFARFDTDTDFSDVDVNRLVEDVVELTRHKWLDEAQSKGRTIEIRTRRGDVPPALGSYAELSEVLANLVINACEAISGNGVIELSAEGSQDRVQILVSDTGCGMSAEVAQKVFEPFYTTKGSSGTGLGLSVAFGIISRHNGTIDVESQEGVGTTVRLSLPIAPVAETRVEMGTCRTAAAIAASILVIEDQPLIRETMADILALEGHRVTLACDGEEGIALFEDGEYDIVCTDLGMPGLSGWEVVRAIKQRRHDVPVIMVTGWGVTIDQSQMEREGVEAVIAKPFDMEEVLGIVRNLMQDR